MILNVLQPRVLAKTYWSLKTRKVIQKTTSSDLGRTHFSTVLRVSEYGDIRRSLSFLHAHTVDVGHSDLLFHLDSFLQGTCVTNDSLFLILQVPGEDSKAPNFVTRS